MKIKIACLPIAGRDNPYQYLMINGLNSSDQLEAYNGEGGKFTSIFKTVIKTKPNFIHFDWITRYYERRNVLATLIFLPLFLFQVLFVKYFTKTKIVWTLHNIVPHNVKFALIHKITRRFFARYCDWIRVFSQDSVSRATNYLKIDSAKFIVIPEGDYTTEYPNESDKISSRKILELDNEKIILLSLGYIKPYKGLENLINIFIKGNNKNKILLIVGESKDHDYCFKLKKIIKGLPNQIRIEDGFIEKERLQYFYNAADIVVLPFDKIENSGSTIMAMGFKKAILAPDTGVLKSRLKEQKELLYKDLETGLHYVFGLEKNKLKELGENNYKALQNYHWEDFSKAFLNKIK